MNLFRIRAVDEQGEWLILAESEDAALWRFETKTGKTGYVVEVLAKISENIFGMPVL